MVRHGRFYHHLYVHHSDYDGARREGLISQGTGRIVRSGRRDGQAVYRIGSSRRMGCGCSRRGVYIVG
jgi:hypothetical protein